MSEDIEGALRGGIYDLKSGDLHSITHGLQKGHHAALVDPRPLFLLVVVVPVVRSINHPHIKAKQYNTGSTKKISNVNSSAAASPIPAESVLLHR